MQSDEDCCRRETDNTTEKDIREGRQKRRCREAIHLSVCAGAQWAYSGRGGELYFLVRFPNTRKHKALSTTQSFGRRLRFERVVLRQLYYGFSDVPLLGGATAEQFCVYYEVEFPHTDST